MTPTLLVLALTVAPSPADGPLIDPLDEPRFAAPKEKGTVARVEGHTGRATRFTFEAGGRGVFATSRIKGAPAWDDAEGFSFRVKGNGPGGGLAGLELIYDEDYAVRYDLAFPVEPGAWRKVTVAWRDLVPVLPGPGAKPLGGPGGNAPSKLSALWVGRWWYSGDYPALDFTLDDLRLEPKIERPADPEPPAGAPPARVKAKLLARKPVTVVTMGDSLTDPRHRANRKERWPEMLRATLKAGYGSEVTVVDPAVGGTQLKQNLVLIPSWLARAPAPDLVTVFFGGNDWEAGMRGPEFERACVDAVDRIRRATGGKADVLLMTPAPAADRWDTTAELAEACRRAARARNAGLADTERAFHDAGRDETRRARLFVSDRVHLSRDGHAWVAEVVNRALDLVPGPAPSAPGTGGFPQLSNKRHAGLSLAVLF